MTDDTGGEDTGDYDPNDGESRGTSGFSTGEIDLSKLTADYTAQHGETLTGKLGKQVKISVADGATVTLKDVTIEGKNWAICPWASLTCQGDATLIIEGTNYVQRGHQNYPAIYVSADHTLTIKGTGKLTADASKSLDRFEGYGAGIGGGLQKSCGNIVIEGGTITAIGGHYAAGIGCGQGSNCGSITITGANVTAIGGPGNSYGIGASGSTTRGTILGTCGTVTVGDKVGLIAQSSYTYNGIIDLSKVTSDYTVRSGDRLTGKLGGAHKISVPDGAVVPLSDVTINGVNNKSCDWAGLNCSGDATIILEGRNSIKGFYGNYPGIHVPQDKTLTIKGDGELTASSNGYAAGIGAGLELPCGNIVIEGGTIEAEGGEGSAGIGGGYGGDCGTITISGANVNATKGKNAPYSIGRGKWGTCGTVTIGNDVGEVEQSPYSYEGFIDLSTVTSDYTAQDGKFLTGKLNASYFKISVADGATVTLRDVTINGERYAYHSNYNWAGLNCLGDATIILKGRNSLKGFYQFFPGIHVPEGKTLTISGDGELTARSNAIGAGIGGGYGIDCGNIVIESGTITAKGGEFSAGIGGGLKSDCGNINIVGGTITATG